MFQYTRGQQPKSQHTTCNYPSSSSKSFPVVWQSLYSILASSGTQLDVMLARWKHRPMWNRHCHIFSIATFTKCTTDPKMFCRIVAWQMTLHRVFSLLSSVGMDCCIRCHRATQMTSLCAPTVWVSFRTLTLKSLLHCYQLNIKILQSTGCSTVFWSAAKKRTALSTLKLNDVYINGSLIYIFIIMYEMIIWKRENVNRVAHSDEPTLNYHLNLWLLKALQSFIVIFSSMFGCPAANLLIWFTVNNLIALSCL